MRHAKGVIGDAAGSGLRAQEARRRRQPGMGVPVPDRRSGFETLQRGGFSSERDAAEALERAVWRMTISPGHRFEATQALRQVLARAVVWGMIDSNPAKRGVDNPQRRRTEKRPFESWAQLDELAARLGQRYGPPVLFAAATGFAARRVDGARAARHRPPNTSRLRPSRTQKRPAQEHEDRGEHPRGAAAGHRAGSARPTQSRP
jgi:hypothetical protein